MVKVIMFSLWYIATFISKFYAILFYVNVVFAGRTNHISHESVWS